MIKRFVALPFAIALASAPLVAQTHRAILVSFDGFSEPWLRRYADSASAPHLFAIFQQGVCAEASRPAFPSVTPVSHASIWTGTYAKTNGVSASQNAAIPWPDKTILETVDGYKPVALRAEPIWISAARQGIEVYSHMATQSPQPPAYLPVDVDTPALDSARASAARGIALPNVAALNTYNEMVEGPHLARTPAELSWAFGKAGDSLHARIRDDSSVVVQLNHDARRSVVVKLAPVDTTDPRTRPLARYFSAPLRIDLSPTRRTFVYFRLWELSRDHTHLLLFASEARVIQANHPEIAAAYDAAVQGVPGNGATSFLEHGAFGPRATKGGDGRAELMYFETAELVTRQFMRGGEWGWERYHPQLMTDYLPYPDEILHHFLSYADEKTPGVSAAGRRNAALMLKRGYMLVDLNVAQLERLASGTSDTRLLVTGEHGMRPTWLAFKPNVILKNAGLLTVGANGQIDLARTKALWTYGAWITVNSTKHKGGIVPPDSVGAVLDSVEVLLRWARDSAGTPIVTRVFRANTVEGDSLGLGGPGGGDLYVDVAPGYYWGPAYTGGFVSPLESPMGEHGFASIDRDMQPALCMTNAGPPRRIGVVRTIDIAPTISAWLGIAPPRESAGRVLR